MKKLLAVMALSASLSAVFAQSSVNSTATSTAVQIYSNWNPNIEIGSFMSQNNLSAEDAAAAIALARATGVEPSVILSGRGSSTASFYDLAPAYWIASNSSQPVGTILGLYNSGQSWMDIARTYNVAHWMFNPDNVDTTSWSNSDFTNAVWRNIMTTHMGVLPADYTSFSARKLPWNEVVVAEVYGLETGQQVSDVWNTYSSNSNSWTVVQRTYAKYIPVVQTRQVATFQETGQSRQVLQSEQVTRTITVEKPVTRTIVRTVYVSRPERFRTARGSHAMRMVHRRHRIRRHKKCVCTCPEHKRMMSVLRSHHLKW